MSFNFNFSGITPADVPSSEGSAGGVTGVNSFAGLCMWLDGEINSREGVRDENLSGMQNLVYCPLVANPNDYKEYLNGTPVYTEKGIKLTATSAYPSYELDEATFEFCVDIEPDRTSSSRLLSMAGQNFVWYIDIGLSSFGFNLKQSSNFIKRILTAPPASGKLYFAVTTKFSEADSCKLYMNGVEVANPSSTRDDAALTTVNTKNTPIICGGWTPQTDGSGLSAGDIVFHSVRVWSRVLNADEIKQNYKFDYKRFGA